MKSINLTTADLEKLRDKVVDCASVWAEFQEPDSLADQQTDEWLRMEATKAGYALRDASDNYAMAQARFNQQDYVPGSIQD